MTAFAGTYLGQLQPAIGSRLMLMPGAQVVVLDPIASVLMQRRADSGHWQLPPGSAEPGQSFVDIAEEVDIVAQPEQLEAFASLSDPEVARQLGDGAVTCAFHNSPFSCPAVDGDAGAHPDRFPQR